MSQEVAEVVDQAAERVASAAAGYGTAHSEWEVQGPKPGGFGGGRQIAYVSCGNRSALRATIYNHALERAIYDSQVS
jgi:hypothetical protein